MNKKMNKKIWKPTWIELDDWLSCNNKNDFVIFRHEFFKRKVLVAPSYLVFLLPFYNFTNQAICFIKNKFKTDKRGD